MTNSAQSDAESDPLLERISSAAEGLFVMSETDSPLTPFRWPRFFAEKTASDDTAAALRVVQKLPSETAVETVPLEKFFRKQVEPDDEDDEEIAEEKRRLAEMRDLLSKELEDTAVYRIGEVNITVYVLGHVPGTTDAAGVSADLVET